MEAGGEEDLERTDEPRRRQGAKSPEGWTEAREQRQRRLEKLFWC